MCDCPDKPQPFPPLDAAMLEIMMTVQPSYSSSEVDSAITRCLFQSLKVDTLKNRVKAMLEDEAKERATKTALCKKKVEEEDYTKRINTILNRLKKRTVPIPGPEM